MNATLTPTDQALIETLFADLPTIGDELRQAVSNCVLAPPHPLRDLWRASVANDLRTSAAPFGARQAAREINTLADRIIALDAPAAGASA